MATALTAIISVINPTHIAIYGSAVSPDMYEQIYEKCNDIVPTVFMPELKIIPDFEDISKTALRALPSNPQIPAEAGGAEQRKIKGPL